MLGGKRVSNIKGSKKINTQYRKIVREIPVPESMEVLNVLRQYEPKGLGERLPVVWDKAEGFQVYDKYGNMWLDWTSGILVTASGHSRREIRKAICEQVNHGLLFAYYFPTEIRAKLVKKLIEMTPKELNKVFLLSTGAETTECAIKMAWTWGQKKGGKRKKGIISFEGAFHGRTLGSQMIGGIAELKEWIGDLILPNVYQALFPGDWRRKSQGFSEFEAFLDEKKIDPRRDIAMVITEPYQGSSCDIMPRGYAQKLAKWCKTNQVLLIFDEVQSGFGRTGKMFGFEHCGVMPDLICCGKAISSSLPLSAVIGKGEIMDLASPGTLSSTHSGNPVCAAAALAALELIQKENLVSKAAQTGRLMKRLLFDLKVEFPQVIGAVQGIGLVYGLHIVKEDTTEPDGELAREIVEEAVRQGLMLIAPIGEKGATIKICPPLTISEEAVKEGVNVLRSVIKYLVGKNG